LDEGSKADAAAVKAAWGDKIDFEAYADMDISELESKLDEAKAGIEEMTDKQYEINISWDGIDQLEKSFDEMGDFASMMEKDVKKVGKSY
jgi:predicted RNase H-like nuclease (RuvC/YqgF family)